MLLLLLLLLLLMLIASQSILACYDTTHTPSRAPVPSTVGRVCLVVSCLVCPSIRPSVCLLAHNSCCRCSSSKPWSACLFLRVSEVKGQRYLMAHAALFTSQDANRSKRLDAALSLSTHPTTPTHRSHLSCTILSTRPPARQASSTHSYTTLLGSTPACDSQCTVRFAGWDWIE